MSQIVFRLFFTDAWLAFVASSPSIAGLDLKYHEDKFNDAQSYLMYLALDPAHGGASSSLDKKARGLLEALTALDAVCKGVIGGPIFRHSATIDFVGFGPICSVLRISTPTYLTLVRASNESDANKLACLHKSLFPILLDVKSSPEGENEGGIASVLKALKKHPNMHVLFDACWLDADDRTTMLGRVRAENVQGRFCYTDGNYTFEFAHRVYFGTINV